ncbi:MAG: PEP-CTERM sorting domain-containing protein [Planctomycetales bacterium]|nr:PEP-CTERM sorting domain-containing protein [Planctomycetales bacterium]
MNAIGTWFGDSNLDGVFNTSDLVTVFQEGQYEDGIDGNSSWTTGDWNGDGEFDTGDLVLAFQDGGFEVGPRQSVASVPEPSSTVGLFTAFVFASLLGRRLFHL